MRRTFDIQGDKNVANEVYKYPCIYDRADPKHGKKHHLLNAWEKIDIALEFAEGKQFS